MIAGVISFTYLKVTASLSVGDIGNLLKLETRNLVSVFAISSND
jgi:hypothetical protein